MVELAEIRSRLTPEQEDDLSLLTPGKPSELRSLPDEELYRLFRKLAFANRWQFDGMLRMEMTTRLISSLKDFKQASDRSSRILVVLTATVVVLTVVLVWLTATL